MSKRLTDEELSEALEAAVFTFILVDTESGIVLDEGFEVPDLLEAAKEHLQDDDSLCLVIYERKEILMRSVDKEPF